MYECATKYEPGRTIFLFIMQANVFAASEKMHSMTNISNTKKKVRKHRLGTTSKLQYIQYIL